MNEVVLRMVAAKKTYTTLSKKVGQRFPSRTNFTGLHETNLEIHKGEILGVVGDNGAGKSTLLRLISGGTPPTSGELIVRATPRLISNAGIQMSALTVRENAELVGRSHGLPNREAKKFAEQVLVDSDLVDRADFRTDTLSAGMKVRFAFFLAVSGSPELVLMDEILSLSDEKFRALARRRVEELISTSAATVITSHSKTVIRDYATRVIVLEEGRIVFNGSTKAGLAFYS